MGVDLAPREAFPQVLGELLDEEGRSAEVFNVALAGWSTRQERIAYEKLVRPYRPDRVVVAVCLNDIDELQNNLSRPPAWLAGLHARSALVRRLVNARAREIESTLHLFTRADTPPVREAFQRFFAELSQLRDAVRGDGAALAVLVLPYRFQLEPGAPPASVQEKIAAFCRAENIPCVDALPFLSAGGPALFMDGNHLNAAGARAVAIGLRGSELVPSGPSFGERLEGLKDGCAKAPTCLDDALGDRDPAVREAAVWGIARLGRPSARTVALLARCARTDSDAAVRARSVQALGSLNAAAAAKPELVAALGDPEEAVRWAAIRVLDGAQLRPPGDVPALVGALRSEDPFVRDFAASLLGSWGSGARDAAAALAEAARREDESGLIATRALAKIGPAAGAALPSLLASLRDGEARRREKTAIAIGSMGASAEPAVAALGTCLSDPVETVRAACARALESIGPAAAAAGAPLGRCTSDPAEGVRLACVEALGRLGPEARPSTAPLLSALDDASPTVRHAAARSLAAAGALAEALAHLTQRLGAPEEDRRLAAAGTLAELGPEAAPAVDTLARGLEDGSPAVRAECARALGRIGTRAASVLPALVGRLRDPEAHVRLLAVRALGRIGDQRAAPELRARFGDPDPRVVREARKALAQLTGGAAPRAGVTAGEGH
jgi:HEAT repeat protein/lysophospholipase L1-like esterase